MRRVAFWKRVMAIGYAIGWGWLEKQARTRHFRARLALEKFDRARALARENERDTSDDQDAAIEEDIRPIVRRPRAKRVKRSAEGG